MTENETLKLRRVAKGKKPQYFHDPATDSLFSMVVTLTQELSVAIDRIDTLEGLLAKNSVLSQEDIEFFEPEDERSLRRESDRADLIRRVFRSSRQNDEKVKVEPEQDINTVLS
jgi:hypothetical protein